MQTDPCCLPLSSKVAKFSFWSQQMRNVLKFMQKKISDFFQFIRLTKTSTRKLSFAQIFLKLGSANFSEDSKKIKKHSL